MIAEPVSGDALILQQLVSGEMTLDYARELVAVERAFEAHQQEYRQRHPGQFLAVVAGQLIHDASYTAIMSILMTDFAGHPFFLEFPPGAPAVPAPADFEL
jgi:hypothetical protein